MTIREPIHLNSLSNTMSVGDSFADGIRAGYEMFALSFTPEQLLLLIRGQEEPEETSDITTIVSNENLHTHLTLNINVINRFFNKMMAVIDNQYSYRDYTYVSSFLAKSGIRNVDEFISSVKNYLGETKQVMATNKLYRNNIASIKMALGNLDIYDEKTVSNSENSDIINFENANFTANVLKRTATFDNASMVNRYAASTTVEAKYSTALPDISYSRQQEYAYNMEQSSFIGIDDRTYRLVHLNPYETRISYNSDERTVTSQVISAVLSNIADNLYVLKNTNGSKNDLVGFSSSKTILKIFSDSVTRLIWNQTKMSDEKFVRRVSAGFRELLKQQCEGLVNLVEEIRADVLFAAPEGAQRLVNHYGLSGDMKILRNVKNAVYDEMSHYPKVSERFRPEVDGHDAVHLGDKGIADMDNAIGIAKTTMIEGNAEMWLKTDAPLEKIVNNIVDGGLNVDGNSDMSPIVNETFVDTANNKSESNFTTLNQNIDFNAIDISLNDINVADNKEPNIQKSILTASIQDSGEDAVMVYATRDVDGKVKPLENMSIANNGIFKPANAGVKSVENNGGSTKLEKTEAIDSGKGLKFSDATNVDINIDKNNNIQFENNLIQNEILRQKLVNIRIDMKRARKEALLALENQELVLNQVKETKTELAKYNEAVREDIRRSIPEESRDVIDRVNQYLENPEKAKELGITVPNGDFHYENQMPESFLDGDVTLVYGGTGIENDILLNMDGSTSIENIASTDLNASVSNVRYAKTENVIDNEQSTREKGRVNEEALEVSLANTVQNFENSTIELIRDYVHEYILDFTRNSGEAWYKEPIKAFGLQYQGGLLKEQIFQNIQELMNVLTDRQPENEDSVELVFSTTPEQMDELKQIVSVDVDDELKDMTRIKLQNILNNMFASTKKTLETVISTMESGEGTFEQDNEPGFSFEYDYKSPEINHYADESGNQTTVIDISGNDMPEMVNPNRLSVNEIEKIYDEQQKTSLKAKENNFKTDGKAEVKKRLNSSEGTEWTTIQQNVYVAKQPVINADINRSEEYTPSEKETNAGMDNLQLEFKKGGEIGATDDQAKENKILSSENDDGTKSPGSEILRHKIQTRTTINSIREIQRLLYEKYIYAEAKDKSLATTGISSQDMLVTLVDSWIDKSDVNLKTYREIFTSEILHEGNVNSLSTVNESSVEKLFSNEVGLRFVYDRSSIPEAHNSSTDGINARVSFDNGKRQVVERNITDNESVNEYIENVNVTNHTENNMKREGDSIYYEKLQKSMESLVERQISGISERVYSRLEKKMSNERSRRGY